MHPTVRHVVILMPRVSAHESSRCHVECFLSSLESTASRSRRRSQKPKSALGTTSTMAAATDSSTGDNLRSLIFKFEDGKASLSVLDQLLLPHETKYVPVNDVNDAWDAVRQMLMLDNFYSVLLCTIRLSTRSSFNCII